MVKVGKKNTQQTKRIKSQHPKEVDYGTMLGLTQGQKPNEKMQPILWTELPTSALVGAGSLCPNLWTLKAE